jgi:hypothetical protein
MIIGYPLAGLVERGGFEPPKASPTDLQSVPFGRSGTSPTPIPHALNKFPVMEIMKNQYVMVCGQKPA